MDTTNNNLIIQGIDLDRIQSCGPEVTMDNSLTGPWARNDQPLSGDGTSIFIDRAATALCNDIFRKRGCYRKKETMDEVVRRTTSADQGFSGQRSSSEDKKAFEQYREVMGAS